MRIRKSRLRWKECEKFIYEKNGVSVQGSWTGSGKLSTKYQCLSRKEGGGLEEAKPAPTPGLLVPRGVWEGQVASWERASWVMVPLGTVAFSESKRRG